MSLIKCSECGQEVSDKALACPHCGAPVVKDVYCTRCGAKYPETAAVCPSCGLPNPACASNNRVYRDAVDGAFENGPSGKSRGVCAILAILLGNLGIHYFYMGKPLPGIVFLLTCWSTIPWIISIIQGVMMLCSMTQEEFEKKYLDPDRSFPLF